MPPKSKKPDKSKKTEQKKKKQIVEDKTFGLKNKNKSKKVREIHHMSRLREGEFFF